jgi:hypothetical protein
MTRPIGMTAPITLKWGGHVAVGFHCGNLSYAGSKGKPLLSHK